MCFRYGDIAGKMCVGTQFAFTRIFGVLTSKIIQKGQQTAKIEPEEKTEIVRVDGF